MQDEIVKKTQLMLISKRSRINNSFIPFLREQKMLRKATLNIFYKNKDDTQDIIKLCRKLYSLKLLFRLSMNTQIYDFIRLDDFLSPIWKRTKSLSNFKIDLENIESQKGKWCEYTLRGLTNLTNLRTLDLKFYWSEVDDIVINQLSYSLKRLVSLTSLTLDFFTLHLGHNCLEKVANGLRPNSLLHLKLKVPFNLTKKADEKIMIDLLKCLKAQKCLSCLCLILDPVATIHDQDLSSLSESLSVLKSLRKIKLYFNGLQRSQISNKGIQNLFENLQSLPKLSKFSLFLLDLNNIDDQLVVLLPNILKEETSLTSIKLKFYYCGTITSDKLRELSTILQSHKKYERILIAPISPKSTITKIISSFENKIYLVILFAVFLLYLSYITFSKFLSG